MATFTGARQGMMDFANTQHTNAQTQLLDAETQTKKQELPFQLENLQARTALAKAEAAKYQEDAQEKKDLSEALKMAAKGDVEVKRLPSGDPMPQTRGNALDVFRRQAMILERSGHWKEALKVQDEVRKLELADATIDKEQAATAMAKADRKESR